MSFGSVLCFDSYRHVSLLKQISSVGRTASVLFEDLRVQRLPSARGTSWLPSASGTQRLLPERRVQRPSGLKSEYGRRCCWGCCCCSTSDTCSASTIFSPRTHWGEGSNTGRCGNFSSQERELLYRGKSPSSAVCYIYLHLFARYASGIVVARPGTNGRCPDSANSAFIDTSALVSAYICSCLWVELLKTFTKFTYGGVHFTYGSPGPATAHLFFLHHFSASSVHHSCIIPSFSLFSRKFHRDQPLYGR